MTSEKDPAGFLAFKVVRRFLFKIVRLGARVPCAAVGAADFKKITAKITADLPANSIVDHGAPGGPLRY
jgi:hypothetical protein